MWQVYQNALRSSFVNKSVNNQFRNYVLATVTKNGIASSSESVVLKLLFQSTDLLQAFVARDTLHIL